MAAQTHRGIPLSALSPKFLHTNSTSHTWPFSAIAELIDNAYDPDVSAKQFWIDKTRIKGMDCLTFMDNGAGMNYDKMHKMLSFGFSDKQEINGHIPVGLYGNGFKSGSMRLGKDAIVFSKTRDIMCVGLLSQSYLEAIRADHVIVPIVSFVRVGQNQFTPATEHAASLQDILRYSLFKTESEIFSELRAINATCSTGSSGTRIIIWNLRRKSNEQTEQTEFDFNVNRYDIQIPADVYESTSEKYKRQNRTMQSVPESDYSLRAYCSILYLKPRMQIVIRGQKVKTQLISKSLAYIAKDHYRPTFLSNKRIRITFGYNTKSKDQYGIMMYHKNRLIKAYERVGCQLKANNRGVGVIGVIECNFLEPTHNKQDFDYTDEYRKTMNNLGVKLEEYWNEIRYKRDREDPNCTIPVEDALKRPDQNWVQCDECLKWRKLPDGIDCSLLPDKWFCHMNPDPQFRSCHVEEEPEDSDDEQRSYQKTYKQHERYNKMQQERTKQQIELAKKKVEMQRIAALAQQNEALRRQHEDLKRQLKQSSIQVAMPRTQHVVSNNTRGPLGGAVTSSSPHSSPVERAAHTSTMPIISNVCSLSTPSRMKRTLSINPDSTEAKRVKLNGLHGNTAEAAETTPSVEACPSSPMIIPDDDDDDIVILEASSTPRPRAPSFDLAKVKTEHKVSEEVTGMHMECSDDAAVETPAESVATETDAAETSAAAVAASSSSPSPQQQVSTTTQTDPKPSVKDEEEERRTKEKEKEDGAEEVEANHQQEEERNEGEVAAEDRAEAVMEAVMVKEERDVEQEIKDTEERVEETEGESAADRPQHLQPEEEERQAEEQVAEQDAEREGEVQAGGTAAPDSEKDRLLQEAQQQQDELMELMQAVAHERDQYKEQVHQLTCQVADLEKRAQELTEAIVKKELCDQATETEWPEEAKEEGAAAAENLSQQEVRRLYQQAKQEVEELKREREAWGASTSGGVRKKEEETEEDRDEDELVLKIDSLFRDLDQSNKRREELQSKLEAAEMERSCLSSQCEQLRKELEELRREPGRGAASKTRGDVTEEETASASDNPIAEEATSDRKSHPSAEEGTSDRADNLIAEERTSNKDDNLSAEEGTSDRDSHPGAEEGTLNGAGSSSAEETGISNRTGNPRAENKLLNESNNGSIEERSQNGTSRSVSPEETPEETHRLRMLRQNIGRLLVTFVPALDLNQVNYDCDVIDEILEQVLDEVGSTGST
ncbi:MORC family CW-type zinc finger protein 3a [Megalops cyprinoides]|uniref:MORC family CW-type zinc finger protein 3a n=1 Tax=Megalops cyprinoides TaxID=118141 RepID=UPI001864FBBE|nr:MORC family CW-type zinc finger protein 3a [Megalops cyprinoides]